MELSISKIKGTWEYIVIVLMILASGAVIGTMYLGKVYVLEFVFAVIGYLLFRPVIQKRKFIFCIFFLMYITFNFVLFSDISTGNSTNFIKSVLMLISLFIYSLIFTLHNFRKKYVEIMCIIAIYSLICWILARYGIYPFLKTISFDRLDYFMSGAYVYGFKMSILRWSGDLNIIRNFGVFWEPGGFQGYLSVAIIFLLGDRKTITNNRKKLYVLFAALFSTLSTTAFLSILILILVYWSTTAQSVDGKIEITKSKLLTLIIVISLMIIVLNSETVLVKLTDTSTGSLAVRSNDLIESIKVVAQNPLFGYGTYSEYMRMLMNERGVTHNSVGILIVMLEYGVVCGVILFYRIYHYFVLKTDFSKGNKVLVFIVVLMMFCTEHFFGKHLFRYLIF